MNTKALRQKILDLAIRGKLVPQDSNDEPASVLLERIRAEKQQMVKDGKIKAKDIKNDTVIFRGEDNLHYEQFQDGTVKCIEEEIPFEVPEGWEWCRIASISSKITDGEHKTPRRIDSFQGYYLLSARNIQNGFISLEDVDYVDEEEYTNISLHCNPQWGDVLISCSGSIGRVTVVSDTNCYVMVRSAAMIRPILINSYYLMYALQSSILQKQMQELSKQTAQANLFQGAILSLLIPIPPQDEQENIVDSFERKIIEIEKIEISKTALLQLVKITRSRILDLAIRGNLVPQDPNDTPASVLLEHIRAEKEKLIKQGKIKRDKKESIIFKGDDNSYYEQAWGETTCIDDEIPFSIPENWMWCRLKELAAPIDNSFVDGPFGSDLKTEHYTLKKEVRIVQLNNIGDFEWKDTGEKYTTYKHSETISRCISYPNDIVIAKMMPAGKAIILPDVNDVFVISSDCVRLRTSHLINIDFLLYVINSSCIRSAILRNVQGIGRTRTSLGKLKEILIPLPPEFEQLRIVEKIKMLYSQISCIEENL